MRKRKSILILVFGVLLLTTVSCQKQFLDKSVNVDPNNPQNVTNATLLASSEGLLAYNSGGVFSWFCSILDQQTTGKSNQFALYGNYVFSNSDFDSPWTDSYQYTLENLMTLRQQADLAGDTYYSGISRILFVYQMAETTDLWGDVPYSQAFKGKSNLLTPAYDSQQVIYTSMLSLLDTAASQLGNAGGPVVPGSDDLFYKGNAAQWLKAAHVLKARLYLHLGKVDQANYQNAIDAINLGGFKGNADDLSFSFGASDNSAAPDYQLSTQRQGYMDYNGFLAKTMQTMNDPRLGIYLTAHDTSSTLKDLGSYFNSQTSPVFLLTYAEQNFILAEAYLHVGNTTSAQTFYAAGIAASLQKYEASFTSDSLLTVYKENETQYLSANGTLSSTAPLQSVMTQKYFALYLSPESYTDWRRTGYPVLSPANGAAAIPRRFLYPSQEYQYNGANVPANITLYIGVYWDK